MEKTLPADLDAERAVLGAVLMNREALLAIANWLQASHFYFERHAWIYAAMLACLARSTPPDTRTVSDELRRRDQLDSIGGVPYLADLIDATPTSYHVEHYAAIVERTAILRRLIAAGGTIAALGYDEQGELETTLTSAQAHLTEASRRRSSASVVPFSAPLETVFTAMMNGTAPGLPSGFADYDHITGGLHPHNLLILAGRPGHGKTGLALSLALNVADDGRRVLIFELEMSKEELAQRAIAQRSGVDLARIRRHCLNDEQIGAVVDAMGPLSDLPIAVDDSGASTLTEIRARALRELNEHGELGLVIIDYVQLVCVTVQKGRTREQEVAEVSRGLKALAKELRCPVLALAQLNRAIEHRSDAIPTLADLRESGQLEQDADQVLFIVRPELLDKDTSEKGLGLLYIAKHRNGPMGVTPLRFDAATTRFQTLSHRTPDYQPRQWRDNA